MSNKGPIDQFEMETEIVSLRLERDELRDVLQPLAELADAFDNCRPPAQDDDTIHAWCVTSTRGTTLNRELTVGMLREARTLLRKWRK